MKVFFNETMRPTAYIVCMLQCLMIYHNPVDHTPEVKIGHAPVVRSIHDLPSTNYGKSFKNVFSKAMRPSAFMQAYIS